MLTILRVQSGSHAYGLATEDSDEDYVEVYVETERSMLAPGDRRPRSIVLTDPDRQVHPLGRYLQLVLQGNPNALEVLWAPRLQPNDPLSRYDLAWQFGSQLRALRFDVMSARLRARYLGYMRAQTLRLLGQRGGHSAGKAGRQRYVSRDGYDTKYAAHVLRLGYQALDLLDTGDLVLPMPPDHRREQIVQVRRGEVSFADWFDLAVHLYESVERLPTDMQPEPNEARVIDWAIAAYREVWHGA